MKQDKPSNTRLLDAALGKKTDVCPVWCMRQAGRYLPEFREVRKEHDFFAMCGTPSVAAEITAQPMRRAPIDALVIFSDILIVPQAMGMECKMVPGKGPVFPIPLGLPADLAKREPPLCMRPDASETFAPLYAAIKETIRITENKLPVLGFCGGPWTLLSYMAEGGGSKSHSVAKTWLYGHPDAARRMMGAIAETCIDLLVGQWLAGASALQVFESNAGELPPALFKGAVLPHLRRIVKGVRARVPPPSEGGPPMILFARGAHYALEWIDGEEEEDARFDVVSLDWTIDPAEGARRVRRAAVQGNLDPGAFYGGEAVIRREVRKMLEGFGDKPLIANLGWGMQPTHVPEQFQAFVKAVHEISAEIRSSGSSASGGAGGEAAEGGAT